MRPAMSEAPRTSAQRIVLEHRVILLASDGSPGALAAARVAHALAARHHAAVQVAYVVDTRGTPMPPPLDIAFGLADAAAGPAVHAEQAERVRSALATALGGPVAWPVGVTLGTPADAIAREALRTDAALIVVGLRRHGRLDRALEDETTLNVMRRAPCPVLAVIPSLTTLPRRILAAVDFSRASIAAVRAASEIAGDDAKLTLAYVAPVTSNRPDDGEAYIHELGVEAGFERIARELHDESLDFDHVVLHHAEPQPPDKLLLEHAETSRCDLIVAGSARHGRFERWVVGSVSTALVRAGSHSVLVVPPADGAQR